MLAILGLNLIFLTFATAAPPRPAPSPVAVPAPAPVLAPSTASDDPGKLPLPRLQWIDVHGRVLQRWARQRESRWIWERMSKEVPVPGPVLRTWLELPPKVTFRSWKGNGVRVNRNVEDSPLKSTVGEVISIDVTAPQSQVSLEVSNSRTKGGVDEISLLLNLPVSQAVYWVGDSCAELGVTVGKKAGNARFLFGAVNCADLGSSIDLFILHSPDAEPGVSTLAPKIASGFGWAQFRILKREDAVSAPRVLGTVRLKELGGTAVVDTQILRTPVRSRWFFSAGLGVTYMNYEEDPQGVRLTQTGLTPKFNAGYRISDRFDLGANAFFTALALSHSPSSLTSARSYGANARFGWRLAPAVLGAEVHALFGWYFWSLRTSSREYGLDLLSGPQVFLQARRTMSTGRTWFMYVKFAPVSATTSVNLDNRELAIGGGYPVFRAYNRYWSLTLDIADLRYEADGEIIRNRVKLTSYTLGVQAPLF